MSLQPLHPTQAPHLTNPYTQTKPPASPNPTPNPSPPPPPYLVLLWVAVQHCTQTQRTRVILLCVCVGWGVGKGHIHRGGHKTRQGRAGQQQAGSQSAQGRHCTSPTQNHLQLTSKTNLQNKHKDMEINAGCQQSFCKNKTHLHKIECPLCRVLQQLPSPDLPPKAPHTSDHHSPHTCTNLSAPSAASCSSSSAHTARLSGAADRRDTRRVLDRAR